MSEGTVIPFGRYELLERLGMGGMAIVYRARYMPAPGITKPVVIKKVLDVYAENPSFVQMFVHEARISVGLNHGNIVQVFDFGQVNGEYYLAMELVDGQPLSRVLKKAQAMGLALLPEPLAVNIAIEMCKGLHHAHTRTDEKGRPLGLVHRDISPDNVLISYEGEVKISDFGVAKAKLAGRPETEAGMVKGKYLYFSPEQALGEELDARSDVYAVGVVLFRMLCGRLPAEGPEVAVMTRIVQGKLTPATSLNPQLDPRLVDILREAMANRKEDRIPSAEELMLQLSHWLATRAPLFPAHTLKHMMGFLYEPELTALGRPPQVAERFRDQVSQWSAHQRWREVSDQEAAVGMGAAAARPPPRKSKATAVTKAEEPGAGVTKAQDPGTGEVSTQVTATEASPFAEEGRAKTRKRWFAAGAVLAVLLGLGIGIAMRLRIPPLEVTSEPPGAQVFMDGQSLGVTPLKVEGFARNAPHTVEMSLKGMRLWSRAFPAGALTTRLDVALEPVPPPPPQETPAPPPPAEDFASRLGTDQMPARFTLQEKWHSFSTTVRSLQRPLNPKRSYTVWTSGSYTGDVPISEQDLRQGLTPASSRSGQVYVFVEGAEAPAKSRLFMASSRPRNVSKARALHAFVLVGITAERNADKNLTLHVRDNTSGDVTNLRLDARRYAHQVALENRYSVRQLEPESWYAVEIRPREGAAASSVAVLVVPKSVGRVQMTGQPAGEVRYALRPGRYTLQGARELWFALPRAEGDGEARMDVSVTKTTPPPPEPPVEEVSPEEAGGVVEGVEEEVE